MRGRRPEPPWMHIKRIPYNRGAAAFRDALLEREEFESNSMHAHPVRRGGRPGSLYPEDSDYLISSYGTPIAWHSKSKGWCCPKVTYSQTTGRQQSIIREAIALMGYRPCHPRICPARTGELRECTCGSSPFDMVYLEPGHENTELPEGGRKEWRIAA